MSAEDFDELEEQTGETQDAEEKNDKEEKSISSDLIRGHINTIILRSLADGDKYGYEIIAEIERKSHGQYSLKQPSLYSALKRLEKDGFITSYWGGSVGGGRRKYFSLTDAGKAVTEQNQSEWEYSRTIIDSLISDKDFDFNNPAPSAVNMRVLRDTTSRVYSSGASGEDSLGYEPDLAANEEREKLNAQLKEKEDELARERASFEEDRTRYEEEIAAMREEEERLRAEHDERLKELDDRARLVEEERSRTEALRQEAAEERSAQYEALLREQNDALEAERIRHEQELVEQERRIRMEQEELFRKREQQLLHQNYLNLVNAPPVEKKEETEYTYFTPPVAEDTPPAPPQPDEREYRSVVQKLYENSVQGDADSSPAIERARSLDGIAFDDIEARAAEDGIKITTAGAKTRTQEQQSESIVHKGKALFLSALVVFFLSILEGGIVLGLVREYHIPVYLPYLMWGLALALLLATGLAFANHYGERALRRCGPVLVNAIVSYVLVVILALIIALGVNIDFNSPGQLASYVVIPIIYFFSIVVFGVVYYLQVRPKR